jgi:hypothetical protein
MSIKHPEIETGYKYLPILYAVCDEAEEDGLLELREAQNNDIGHCYVYIDKFRIDQRGKGNGTRFMERLCATADDNGIDLELIASTADAKNSGIDLKRFYGKFGFYGVANSNIMRRVAKGNEDKFKVQVLREERACKAIADGQDGESLVSRGVNFIRNVFKG